MGIDWKHLVLQRVLNLPEKAKTPQKDQVSGADSQRVAAPADNPWLAAGADEPQTETRPVRTATGVPWRIEEASGSAQAWRRIGRTVLVVVLLFFAWVGARTAFFPGNDTAPQLPAAVTFDTAQAAGVATRFATTAMTWNEDDAKAHADGVALDYVTGADPLGWNGKGRQDVRTAIPGPVVVDDAGKSARVTVYAQTVTYTREALKDPWTSLGSQWITVEVPVAWSADGARLVATAAPALTGQAAPSKTSGHHDVLADSELGNTTKATAEAFFKAYGDGDVSAVEAPGAKIAAPRDDWTFKNLTSWVVEQADGTPAHRAAYATVTWSQATEKTEITQTYRLTLSPVSSGGADRWQVAAIAAG